jgi:hypothetical protein
MIDYIPRRGVGMPEKVRIGSKRLKYIYARPHLCLLRQHEITSAAERWNRPALNVKDMKIEAAATLS